MKSVLSKYLITKLYKLFFPFIKMRIKKRVWETFHIIIIALAIIMFWRGIWGLMDYYLFPDNPLLSHILSIVIGILILYSTEKMGEYII